MNGLRRFLAWYWQPRSLAVILTIAGSSTAAVITTWFLYMPLMWVCVGFAFTDAVVMAGRPLPAAPPKWRPIDVFWILAWHKVDRIIRRRQHKLHCVCYGNREGLT